jgi:hypothetical protein
MRPVSGIRLGKGFAPCLFGFHACLDFLLGSRGLSLALIMTGSVVYLFIAASKGIEISHLSADTKSHKGGRQPRRVGTQLQWESRA